MDGLGIEPRTFRRTAGISIGEPRIMLSERSTN